MIDLTCLCNTHGRPFLVNETLESFLRQDRAGIMCEFLVFNDCPEQILEYSHPDMTIINSAFPVTDLSIKQNIGVELAQGRLVMLWDDDDIFLPGRIRLAVEAFRADPSLCAIAPDSSWFWDNSEIQGRGRRPHYGAACFYKYHYQLSGGAVPDAPPDKSAWMAMAKRGKCLSMFSSAKDTQFIYRWHGTGSCHDSDLTVHASNNRERHEAFRRKVMSDPKFERGRIVLQPGWKQDYTAMVDAAIKEGKGAITV
jgi:hypothetical protein